MRLIPAILALTCTLAVPAVAVPAVALAVTTPVVRAAPAAAPAFNSTVWSLAFRGDVVYAGGSFTEVTFRGRTYQRKRLAAFSARTGAVLPWNPTATGTVRSLAVTVTGRPAVYAAGDFDEIGGARRDALARLDAVTGRVAPFSHRVSGSVATLAVGNGRIYVGGAFTAVDGVARRNIAAFSHGTGALDRGFRASTDGAVRALAVTRTRVYAGGDFHRAGGVPQARLVALTSASGVPVRAFRPKAPAPVLDVAVSPTGISAASGGPGGRAVGYTTSGAVRWTHLFDGDVHNLAVLRGVTYVGGHFDRACRSTSTIAQLGCPAGYASRVKLAALDGNGRLTGWNPRANGRVGVHVLTADPARARIGSGGAFTTIGGRTRSRFALFA
ncbi:hypothetical protein AB0J80_32975 [Actinoplanes sp. NPDC049548]|uniref:hypothetical protein n=1 Tax=Actinoplanes sp. NPDC049548 TaxID=3155152 RepID=UPI00341C7149